MDDQGDVHMFDKLFTSASALAPAGEYVEFSNQLKKDSELEEEFSGIPTPVRSADITSVPFHYELHYEFVVLVFRSPKASSIQFARKVYFAGAGKWLVGLVESALVVVTADGQNLRELEVWFSHYPVGDVSRFSQITDDALLTVIKYSLAFELNRTHKWISIGPEIFTLSVDDIITSPHLSGHRNVAVIKIEALQKSLIIRMEVRRYFPLSPNDMRSSGDISSSVVVLPSMMEGLCINRGGSHTREPPRSLRSSQGLAEYWFDHHGYSIPLEAVKHTVDVCLASTGTELIYPAVCVWRHKWTFLPGHTKEYLTVMGDRITRELSLVSKLWTDCALRNMNGKEHPSPLPLAGISMKPDFCDHTRESRKRSRAMYKP
jgi:hypothetical protein